MKRLFIYTAAVLALGTSSCTKKQLADAYPNPATVSTTTVEKQFAGVLNSYNADVMYHYWNYFVVLQNTALHYTQAVGWQNAPAQYVPGAAAISDRWSSYYTFLSQYKEMVNVYNKMSETDKKDKRIYLIAATIYFYDHTQKVVDLHGDIPWTQAGLLSTNNGDYASSYPKYDAPEAVYTKMLDDLKGFADELNTISIPSGVTTVMQTQDYINHGNIALWKKYCNSLRVRMLTRVSLSSTFASRYTSEMAAITSNSASYPLVLTNADNIKVAVYNLTTPINSTDFYSGLIGWGSNDMANKGMIDTMNNNADPRLRAMFQPGTNAAGAYKGMDPTLDATTQGDLIKGGTISVYNYSAISKNKYLPGNIINAAEVNFLLSEYYLNAGNDAAAKSAYETGIKASIDFYYALRPLSDDNSSGTLVPTNDAEKNAYLASPGIKWENATTKDAKLNRIAVQKWTNYSVLQPLESWAEIRRTKLPKLTFQVDNTNAQTLPPNRWVYPSSEITYNKPNYDAVASKDKLSTKLFWDVK